MSYHDMLVDYEKHHKDIIMTNTWGHLAPKWKKPYKCWMLYTCTCHGHAEVIDDDFEDLDSSPWLYDHKYEFINKKFDKIRKRKNAYWSPCGVYLFIGYYTMLKADASKYKFVGRVRKMRFNLKKGTLTAVGKNSLSWL